MVIDFNNIEETVINKFRGGEGNTVAKMHTDPLGKIMLGRLEVGASIGMHTHDTSSEVIYVLSGKGKCLYDDTVEELNAGDCHYCPKGHNHSLINSSNSKELVFFAVVPEQ